MKEAGTLFLEKIDEIDIDNKKPEKSIIDEYQKILIESIFTSFGLDILLVNDRYGGDVDTILNVRKIGNDPEMEYKNIKNENAYEERGEYISKEYHTHKNYINKNKEVKELKINGELIDEYTGNKIKRNEKSDLDHVISANEIHEDRGRVLAGKNGVDLANCDENLKATTPNINRSKKADPMEEHIEKKKDKYTEAEKERMRKADKEARKNYEKELFKYYHSKGFLKDTAVASGKLGVKMGARQVLGLMFFELWMSIKEEFTNFKEFWNDLGEIFRRLKDSVAKAIEKIKIKYKEYINKFFEGFSSGIFASLTTTIINIFSTTAKNIVKCTREIWVGIIKAFNILFINPDNYTTGEKFKEVSKVIIVTASIILGNIVRQAVKNISQTFPMELGEILPTFLGTLVTGLVSCTLIYVLEKSEIIKKLKNIIDEFFNLNSISKVRDDLEKNYKKLMEYAAELLNQDVDEFIEKINKFSSDLENLNPDADTETISKQLEEIIKKRGLKFAYEGNFDDFMSDRNNQLEFK